MKIIAKYLFTFICATLVANFFVYFYYSPAVQVPNHDKFTDVKSMPSTHNPHGDEGYGNITIDEYGFNNILGISPAEAETIFIGSSQTEAQHVASNEHFVYLLNQERPETKVYNMGVSASTFQSTFYRIPYLVTACPNAKTLVFEINNMPSPDDLEKVKNIMDSGNIQEKDISWKAGNTFLTTAGKIPLVRLLWRQFDHYRRGKKPKNQQKGNFDKDKYLALLEDILAKGKAQAGDVNIMIFYLAKLDLCQDASVEIAAGNNESELFKQACDKNGIVYMDMGSYFQEAYDSQHVLPYGFLNSPIGTGHLNIYGHRIIAKAFSDIIR